VLAKNLLIDIPVSNLPDSLLIRIHYQSALCAYLAGEFSLAESELKLLVNMNPDPVALQQAILLKILVLNERNDYKTAASLLTDYINGLGLSREATDSLTNAAKLVYRHKNLPRIVKPQRAGILSVFIPGLGHAYAGYPGEGLISLAVNLSSIGIMVLGGLNAYYITGYVAGAGLFQKFYFGGQTRAEYLARRHNYLKSHEFNMKAKSFLLSVQK
jgi:TM2 domain-containing membrane protein YozV